MVLLRGSCASNQQQIWQHAGTKDQQSVQGHKGEEDFRSQARYIFRYQGIINHNNAKNERPEFEKKTKEQAPLKEFVLKDYQGKEGVEEFDTYVIARPLKLFTMKNNVGRSFECVNQHGEIIEILLWSECSAEVQLGNTYRFNYMRVKAFR